ncbi:MAG: hypothetical protein V2A62_02670 [Candidatus Woesearchaeota archaeon]
MECEEPGCTREATRKWGGRKVCQDHYEHYKDAKEKMLMALKEIS